MDSAATPTVLLVHGAFEDSGSWAGTLRAARHLTADLGAVPNPLRGLDHDATEVAAAAAAVPGPVLLAGHGYGGAVASVAATRCANVVALAYVAAFLPGPDTSVVDLLHRSGSHAFLAALVPSGPGDAAELYLEQRAYPEIFAADLDPDAAATAAALQRPVRACAFEERPAAVAGPGLPSWYLVTTEDLVLAPAVQRESAARAGSRTAEVDASHAVLLSRPDAVAALIGVALTHRRNP